MADVNDEWKDFIIDNKSLQNNKINNNKKDTFVPEFTDLYISTQTKIGFLDQCIDLNDLFWKLPIIDYKEAKEGVIKKIMKINSITPEEVNKLEENIEKTR